MNRTSAVALVAALAAVPAFAQAPSKSPAPAAAAQQDSGRAPRETKTATINDKKVAIEYGRPSLRGRTVQQLLSQLTGDRVWRAGVDQATTLRTETDVTIGGQRVPAGKYTMYLQIPATGPASLLLNSDPGVPLKTVFAAAPAEVADALWPRSNYADVQKTEVARIPMTSIKPVESMERFLIALEPAVNGVSALTLTWGDQAWTTSVKAAAAK